jgi:hypothetical protein
MKALNHILFASLIAATIGLADSANAQLNANDDGIAASPRARQILNERKASARMTAAVSREDAVGSAGQQIIAKDGIAASPKVRQLIDQRPARTTSPVSSSEVASSGYRATGSDGITASPKAREQMNERSAVIMVAPVK